MGPDRHHNTKPNYRKPRDPNAPPKAGPSTLPNGKKGRATELRDPQGLPGLQKIKASIRQTKRLLAKDNLEPGLKVSTERRLKSLEADLENAQRRDVEKKNGARYHRIKFFERQKLLRIIKRDKRLLDPTAEAGEELSPKKRKALEKELEEARIMVNYIRHYPNTRKYIALFPASDKPEAEVESTLQLPALFSKKTQSSSAVDGDGPYAQRRELLEGIRTRMAAGEISKEPENEQGPAQGSKVEVAPFRSNGDGARSKAQKPAEEAEADNFFESDGEDE